MKLLGLLFITSTIFAQTKPDDIIGIWLSTNKDLKVEMFKQNNKYFGKIVWFKCDAGQPPMESYKDVENANEKLKKRPWLGMINVENLAFNKSNYWSGGQIYDPNSGRTYSATVKSKAPNTLVVRGFWGFEFIGKNMVFNRL
jgi:uncharacterized protein (DUF2147 family)